MFLDQWKALSGRIRGVVHAGQLRTQFIAGASGDAYGIARHLRRQALSVLLALKEFRDSFADSLPPLAVAAINNCIGKDIDGSVAKLLEAETGHPNLDQNQVWASLVMLSAFETELNFLLSDVQAAIRARSERAFSHLRRLIVVDSVSRQQWQMAFKDGETSCEKRGAVHLLLHGIWAFKVSAAGERTDLVYQEPTGGMSEEQRYADGLVLTEWKVASSDAEAQRQFSAARAQAKRYSQGVLAGSELVAFRYAVVVSPQHITVPADVLDGAVVYRHINIPVDPETPSQERPSKHHPTRAASGKRSRRERPS